MDLNGVKILYQKTIDEQRVKYSELNKRIFQVGTLRLLLILACAAFVYFYWGQTGSVIIGILFTIALFLALMVYHNKLFWKRLYAEVQIKNAENELKGLTYDFISFDGAPEFIDPTHSFSYDLDLFGNRSLFQSMNRTVTKFGKKRFANFITDPLQDKSDIESRQEAVDELSKKQELIVHFRTIGNMSSVGDVDVKELTSTLPLYFQNSVFWRVMAYIVPGLYILLGLLCFLNITTTNSLIYLWLATSVLSTVPLKKVKGLLDMFEKKASVLEVYSRLFNVIESEEYKSDVLKNIKRNVLKPNRASRAISELKKLNDNLGLSFAFPVMLILNPILLWNVRYATSVEKWAKENGSQVDLWFEALSEFEALASLSIFSHNHPDYVYPVVSESVVFEAKDLGHPLLNRDVCVRNDLGIPHKPYFLVVTGANMAGKSTYLRTVGVNHVLACLGAPVCATSFRFYPNKLVTNLRTADSLADNESYFFAELKRLQMIIERLKSGENLFIILDEILKGTNSEDKQKGSLALMRQLVDFKSMGIIATHDLLLGGLENEYPNEVKNYRFEADIKDEHLSFSYKIREGVAQNMNACFLMKKMGITGL